jgi:hypothetical protein
MPLITAAEFYDRFDIDPDIDEKRIDPHIGSASRRLRKWAGDTAYNDALAASPSDPERKDALQNAEAHLTYHFAIRGMNFPLSAKGIVATSMSSEGKEMRKYLTPDETEKVATQMLELAREIAEPYLLSDGTPEGGFMLVEEDPYAGEATTRNYGGGHCC